MNLGKELGDQPQKNINHDSNTDEDPEEFKNQMLDKEIFGKDKRFSMEEDEDIPNLKSSKIKNKKNKDEGVDDGKMKDANQEKYKRKKNDMDDLLMIDGTTKEGNKDKFKRKTKKEERNPD